jgi:uncharacterized protein
MLEQKRQNLFKILTKMGSVLIAFSGGLDSTLLLWAARETLGNRCCAATAVSPIHPPEEKINATRLAAFFNVPHLLVPTSEWEKEAFLRNPPERCYLCKKEMLQQLQTLAQNQQLQVITEGTNADDQFDYRPGTRAVTELGVRSPLREAGLTKKDIRTLSQQLGLPTQNQPAMPCLATRIPYGSRISPEKLNQIAAAENFLRKQGFFILRVRHHGAVARLEILPEEFNRLQQPHLRDKLIAAFKKIGFQYITLDLEGFRSGSLNEVL